MAAAGKMQNDQACTVERFAFDVPMAGDETALGLVSSLFHVQIKQTIGKPHHSRSIEQQFLQVPGKRLCQGCRPGGEQGTGEGLGR